MPHPIRHQHAVPNRRRPRALAALLILAGSVALAASHAPARATVRPTDDTPARCCFTNPRYSGTCEVQPAKDESCAQILGYLNNPMSQGKSYCGSTTIRGGWQSVACPTAK
jgi:hypothetical protein